MIRTWFSAAGLVPALRLADSAGLHELLEEYLNVASPNAVAKATSVVGGMLAGADSIDDMGLLRHGGMSKLFAEVRAPSTLGTYLRSFTHGHVQQLDAVAARLLAGLAARVPDLLAGGTEARRSRSSTSMTRSARSTAIASRAPPTAIPGCGDSTPNSLSCRPRSRRR